MNTVFKHILTVVFLVCCLLTVPAYAEITEQYGVRAELTTDQAQYFGADVVKATLTIQNTHDEALTDVNMRIAIPNGFELVGDSKNTLDFGRINSGSSESLTIELKKTPKSAFLPETGDSSSPGFWGMLLTISTIAFVCLAGRSKRGTRMLCLLLSVSLLSSTLVIVPVSAKADSFTNGSVSVTASTQFDGSPLSITGTIQYSMKVAYTRAEWIEALMDAREYEALTEFESPYKDIVGESYEGIIAAAVAYGILTTSDTHFYPDDPATREFAASTSIRALGYVMEEDIQCADASEITDKKEAYLASDIGLMPLIDNCFLPGRILRSTEADQIFKTVDEIVASENPTGTHKGITYKEGTIVLDPETPFSEQNGMLSLPNSEQLANLRAGDIIVIGDSSYQVTEDVKRTRSLALIIPAIPLVNPFAFIDEIDIGGRNEVNLADFNPAQGVRVNHASALSLQLSTPFSDNCDLNLNIDFSSKYFDFILKGRTIHTIGGDIVYIDNCLIDLDFDTTVGASLSSGTDWTLPRKEQKRIFLGELTIFGTPAFSGVIRLSADISASGQVSLSFSMNGQAGMQILNNHTRNLTNIINHGVSMNASAAIQAGPLLELYAKFYKFRIIGLGLAAGGQIAGTGEWHNTDKIFCFDGSFKPYFTLELMKGTVLKDWSTEIDLLESIKAMQLPESLNLNGITGHWENLRKVEQCTIKPAEYFLSVYVGDGSLSYDNPPTPESQELFYSKLYANVREGLNNKTGTPIYQFAQGTLYDHPTSSRTFLPGNYTVEISRPGYATQYHNVTITEDEMSHMISTALMPL